MSYHIYTTDGIILKRTGLGEANVLAHVLTKDLGLIIATATSARLERSKLRSALQDYSYVTLSCVKGKNGWKITNVAYKDSFYFNEPDYSKKILAQVASVLLRTITGEMPHPQVFEIFVSGLEFLKTVPYEEAPQFEVLTLIRILYELGYVAKNQETEIFLDPIVWDMATLERVKERRELLVGVVNKALKESQM